jgi:hypothetical protein
MKKAFFLAALSILPTSNALRDYLFNSHKILPSENKSQSILKSPYEALSKFDDLTENELKVILDWRNSFTDNHFDTFDDEDLFSLGFPKKTPVPPRRRDEHIPLIGTKNYITFEDEELFSSKGFSKMIRNTMTKATGKSNQDDNGGDVKGRISFEDEDNYLAFLDEFAENELPLVLRNGGKPFGSPKIVVYPSVQAMERNVIKPYSPVPVNEKSDDNLAFLKDLIREGVHEVKKSKQEKLKGKKLLRGVEHKEEADNSLFLFDNLPRMNPRPYGI